MSESKKLTPSGAQTPSDEELRFDDVLPVLPHVQPDPDAEPKVTPAGSESVTVRAVASEGPAFVTTRV